MPTKRLARHRATDATATPASRPDAAPQHRARPFTQVIALALLSTAVLAALGVVALGMAR